jgi:hypothetical protein
MTQAIIKLTTLLLIIMGCNQDSPIALSNRQICEHGIAVTNDWQFCLDSSLIKRRREDLYGDNSDIFKRYDFNHNMMLSEDEAKKSFFLNRKDSLQIIITTDKHEGFYNFSNLCNSAKYRVDYDGKIYSRSIVFMDSIGFTCNDSLFAMESILPLCQEMPNFFLYKYTLVVWADKLIAEFTFNAYFKGGGYGLYKVRNKRRFYANRFYCVG